MRLRALAAIFLLISTACASSTRSPVRVDVPAQSTTAALGFSRVLVAGFLTGSTKEIDANEEAARSLRMALRSKTSLHVIEAEPLELRSTAGTLQSETNAVSGSAPLLPSGVTRADGPPLDPLFVDTTFWRRVGEEYSEPLIVTGTVAFDPVAAIYDERTIGRRTIRTWRRGYSLSLDLVLISGNTGRVIDTVPLRKLTARAASPQEGPLALYLQLMDRMVPSILDAVGQQRRLTRTLLR